jgi:hypothetical protein
MQLCMNNDEFTDAQWLSIPRVFELYKASQMPIFIPQMFLLSKLLFNKVQYKLAALQEYTDMTD